MSQTVDASIFSGSLDLFILQPTPFCNINCSYCYLPNRSDARVMSIETVEAAFRKLFASPFPGKKFTVVWHAGEPLAAPISFYRQSFDIIKALTPASITVRHNVQTNGLLINDEWAKFFAEQHVSVGLSIDGPASVHDAMRVTRLGRGTHARVLDAVRTLRANSVPFHTISVIHSGSTGRPDAFWDFFVDSEIKDVAFNFEEVEGSHTTSSLDAPDSDAALERFTATLFRRYASDASVRVREFDNLISTIMKSRDSASGDDERRPQTSRPFGIISVDVDGNFATFSPELLGQMVDGAPFRFGNVLTDDFESVLRNPRFQQVHGSIESGIARCRDTCAYFSLCRGGCPSNKYFETQSFDVAETAWCKRSKKMVIDVVMRGLEGCLGASQEAPGGTALVWPRPAGDLEGRSA